MILIQFLLLFVLISVVHTMAWVALRKKIIGMVVGMLLLCPGQQAFADVGWSEFPDEVNVGTEVYVTGWANADSLEWCGIYFNYSIEMAAYSDDRYRCTVAGLRARYVSQTPGEVVNAQIWENAFWGNSNNNRTFKVRLLSGSFTSATPDEQTQGRVTISGVKKGNGATSLNILDQNGNLYSQTSLNDETIQLNNLSPGENTIRLHVYYQNIHSTIAQEVKVRILGGSFDAWAENGRAYTKGMLQGGADELRIYRSGSLVKTIKTFTTNGAFSEYDTTIDNLPGGRNNLEAYAYKGSQRLFIGTKQVTLPPDKPARPSQPTWLSPGNNTDYQPSSGALRVGGQATTGVDRVFFRSRVVSPSLGEWKEDGTGTSISVNASGAFSNAAFHASTSWEAGKSYEVQFDVKRGTSDRSPWSSSRNFNVPHEKPPRPTWISPGPDTSYQPSSTPLKISGQTVPGVDALSISIRTIGGTGRWSEVIVPTTVDTNGRFSDVSVNASKTWEAGKSYEVRFDVRLNSQFSEYSAIRKFNVPRGAPGKPTWISPAAGWQKTSPADPLTISGKTVPGVDTVYVSWTVKGGTWSIPVSHTVVLDAGDIFKDVSIEASKLWENGKTYSVRFTVERDSLKALSAERDFKVDTTPPSIAWATGTDPMLGHASPGKPFAVKVDVSDTLSGVDSDSVKLRWKIGAGHWSSDAVMKKGTGNRYTTNIDIPAKTHNDQQLTLQVKATDLVGNALSYDDKHQHSVSISKPVVSLTKPAVNSWHNGKKINVSGTAAATAEIVSVRIGQRQSGTGDYGSWHDLCDSKETCHTTNNAYRFDDVEYNQPLLKKDVEIVVLAKDIHGIATYSTANGEANGVGQHVQYDGKAPEIARANAQWHADGSLTVSGTVSDNASGLGAQGDGKDAIVLRWRAGGGGQHTVNASGSGVGGMVNFSHTFAAGFFPTSSQMTFSVTASDRAGNISAATEAAVISPIPTLTLSVKQLQTPRHAWFANETLVYRLTLEAAADSACATNSHLSYVLPPQLQKQANTSLTLTNSAPTVGATLDPTWGDPGRKNLLAVGGKLCAGESLSIDIPLVIAANASGQNVVNHIDATADGLTGPIALFKTDSFAVMPEQGALRLEKKVDKDIAESGEDLTYTIIFSNTSEQHLTIHEITDSVAAYTRLQGMPECGVMPAGLSCTPSASTQRALRWEFSGELAPGKSGQVSYTVRIQ